MLLGEAAGGCASVEMDPMDGWMEGVYVLINHRRRRQGDVIAATSWLPALLGQSFATHSPCQRRIVARSRQAFF